ncbi:hypothetical protein [Streptomyces hokutonensis]|uniref:hypothetical protein n=1 Tax=Streptomyces hokutonensis TaxID=1306990 RepID=UPI0033E31CCC
MTNPAAADVRPLPDDNPRARGTPWHMASSRPTDDQAAQLRAAEAAGELDSIQGAPFRFKTIGQGAATSVPVATTSPLLEGVGVASADEQDPDCAAAGTRSPV